MFLDGNRRASQAAAEASGEAAAAKSKAADLERRVARLEEINAVQQVQIDALARALTESGTVTRELLQKHVILLSDEGAARGRNAVETAPCPACGKTMRTGARKCLYCGELLPPPVPGG